MVKEKNIILYQASNGKTPFEDWFKKLKDIKTKTAISKRLLRVKLGNYGDYKILGKGVCELRFKSGIRIYYTESKESIVILFCGGDKSSQSKDIEQAKEYLIDMKERGLL